MANQREEIVQHYAKRGMDVDYWNRIIPADPAEIARIYAEVQKEIEQSKRYRWERFPFCGLTLSRAVPIEDEPVGSEDETEPAGSFVFGATDGNLILGEVV